MQLVFRIMKPATTFHGVDYNERKQKKGNAELVYFENFGPLQLGRESITREEFK